jgi:hypothetical protein
MPRVLAAVLASALLVAAGCGDDETAQTVTVTQPPAQTQPGQAPPAQTTPAQTTPSGPQVSGSTYTFAIPQGYQEEQAEGFQESVVKPTSGRGRPIFGVSSQAAPAQVQGNLEELRRVVRAELETVPTARDIQQQPDLQLDGETAVVFEYVQSPQDIEVRTRQFAVVRNGQIYNAAFAAPSELFSGETGAFDQIVQSWRWTG